MGDTTIDEDTELHGMIAGAVTVAGQVVRQARTTVLAPLITGLAKQSPWEQRSANLARRSPTRQALEKKSRTS